MTHPAPAGQGPAGTAPAAPPNGQPPQGGAGSYVWQPAAPQPGAQGAAAASAAPGGDAPATRRMAAADQLQRMFDKYGPERTADILYGENYEFRESNRQLNEQLARRPELPAGAVVLTDKAVIDEWNAFRALNVPAATVATRLAEHERLTADTSRNAALTTAQAAAKALGVGGAAALGELVLDKGLQLEMRDTTVQSADKKTTSVQPMPYLRKAATDQWTPALDYLRQHHNAYVPAITVPVAAPAGAPTGAPGAQGAAVHGTQPAPAAGTAAPAATTQTGTQGAPAAVVVFGEVAPAGTAGQTPLDPVSAIIAQNDARANAPNALRPAAPAPAR